MAALDDPDALAGHLDVGVDGVVGLVGLEDVVLDVDDGAYDVQAVAVTRELDLVVLGPTVRGRRLGVCQGSSAP